MKTTTTSLAGLALLAVAAVHPVHAQDSDSDGIFDEREAQILAQFSPVFRADNSNHRFPPLPVEWMIRRCELRWYYQEGRNYAADHAMLLGTIGEDFSLSVDFLANLFPTGWLDDDFHRYRLSFKNGSNHDGYDPSPPDDESADERTWAKAQERQDCLYGRCSPFDPALSDAATIERLGQYRVQYYMFFGWNDVNADRNCHECPFGNHEGDVILVEFWVEWWPGSAGRVVAAVYHNHGRQVFVDSPSRLVFEDGRPVAYLERDTHEALPWSGDEGICDATAPAGISANLIFPGKGYFCLPSGDEHGGGECDDVPVVRIHVGDGSRLLTTNVMNLGEPGQSYPDAVSRFLHAYTGLLGDDAVDSCDLFSFPVHIKDANSPESPIRQGKMWNSDWQRDQVFAQFGTGSRLQDGVTANPVASFAMGVWMTRPSGELRLRPGTSSERLTLNKPMTITAEGGTATIGQ